MEKAEIGRVCQLTVNWWDLKYLRLTVLFLKFTELLFNIFVSFGATESFFFLYLLLCKVSNTSFAFFFQILDN